MKYLCFLMLILSLQVVRGQTLFVRIYSGIDSFRNPLWNNWNIPNATVTKDSSNYLRDINLNKTTIRAVLSESDFTFDNGTGYRPGLGMAPDTVLRYGSYAKQQSRSLSLIGLNDSDKYNINLFASRNRIDGQHTLFSVPGDTLNILTDTNSSRPASFTGLRSRGGKIVFTLNNTYIYNYLNGFSIAAFPVHHPVARILLDSSLIHSPNSIVHVDSRTSYEIGGGGIASTQWLQLGGPSPAIFTPSNGTMLISGLFPGVYEFGLVVNDALANSDETTINVTVRPVIIPPCPTCPSPIVCPPLRTATGVNTTLVNGSWVLKFTYSDGNP